MWVVISSLSSFSTNILLLFPYPHTFTISSCISSYFSYFPVHILIHILILKSISSSFSDSSSSLILFHPLSSFPFIILLLYPCLHFHRPTFQPCTGVSFNKILFTTSSRVYTRRKGVRHIWNVQVDLAWAVSNSKSKAEKCEENKVVLSNIPGSSGNKNVVFS